MYFVCSETSADFGGFALKDNMGWFVSLASDIHIQPADSLRPPGSQGFEERLLRSETRGQMRDGIAPRAAEFLLAGGEDSSREPILLPLQYLPESADFNDINPDT